MPTTNCSAIVTHAATPDCGGYRSADASENASITPHEDTTDTEETPVVFRVWTGKDGGDVIALFPAEEHGSDSRGRDLISSYMHVGQHCGASWYQCIQGTRPASPEDYAPLKAELESLGYKLRVYQRGAHLLHYRTGRR